MPLSTIGGRDYYTNAVEVTITNSAFSDVPPTTKAIYFATADDYKKMGKEPNIVEMTRDTDFNKKLIAHYNKDHWRLTRFDTGAYWLEVE